MPVTLMSAKIRGVRSYSPYVHKTQTIEFMPLTLIVGSNGSGKTSVIESLKFIISGDEPPLSDSRRNFLHTSNKPAACFDKNTAYACIEVEFHNVKDEVCFAKREISRPTGAKTSTPSISSSFKIGQRNWTFVHKQDDWQKTVPLLFNLPNQAILNNVILCHQDENLWCMGDSSSVKQTFDKIFGCEQYKMEIKHIDAELKTCKSDLMMAEKEMAHTKERAEAKRKLMDLVTSSSIQIEDVVINIAKLEESLNLKRLEKIKVKEEISLMEQKFSRLDALQQKAKELVQREKALLKSFSKPVISSDKISDVELQAHIQNHSNLVKDMKGQQSSIESEKLKLEFKIKSLKLDRSRVQDKMNQMKVIELKSQESYDNLLKSLKNVKIEQAIRDIDENNFKASLQILERVEKELSQNKSNQAELEDNLSNKQQKLSRDLAELEGVNQGVLQKIRNKENFIKKLGEQLAQAEPMVKDLLNVSTNLEKMTVLNSQIKQTDLASMMSKLIIDTKEVVNKLVQRVQEDNSLTLASGIKKEEADINRCKNSLEDLEKKRVDLCNKRMQCDIEHTNIRTASKDAHNRAMVFKNAKSNIINIYHKYEQEKKLLNDKNIDQVVGELQKLDDDIESLQKELGLLDNQYSNISKQIGESFELYEEYKMNFQLRELMLQIEEVSEKVMCIKSKKDDDILFKMLKERLICLEREELESNREQSRLEGSKVQLEKEILRSKEDLKCHSNTNRNHAEVLGRVACSKIIIDDLEKLKECFQKSIIAYHNQMIIKINEVLKARWRQIYQGSDIDLIELVDEEITRGKDKKAFNYYIAMRKNGLRMKMREKSSAGQKALASIILRMTLAELFVKDFSFIALDEPTANLDLANVKSLAKAIGSCVKRRLQKGMNIQWIIITHDEQFLRSLDEESSQYYYKVEMDQEGCSKITKLSYQELGAPSSLGSSYTS